MRKECHDLVYGYQFYLIIIVEIVKVEYSTPSRFALNSFEGLGNGDRKTKDGAR